MAGVARRGAKPGILRLETLLRAVVVPKDWTVHVHLDPFRQGCAASDRRGFVAEMSRLIIHGTSCLRYGLSV
jgi:hypothetical protein